MEIRPATTHDVLFLWDMLYEALFVPPGFPQFPESILKTPGLAKYVEGFGTTDGDVGLVAVEDSGISIGAAWVRQMTADNPGWGFIDEQTPELSIALVAEQRGNGVGSALLGELLDQVPRCSLSVDDRNPAVSLYQRFGFEEVAHDEHSVTMLRAG
jgi:ribosomal protein S18 acetylase RimI-like enzyme